MAPYEAVTFATVGDATAVVVTLKLAVVLPAAMVNIDGQTAAVESEVSVTGAPPGGAGAASVTVPVALLPPVSDAGITDTVVNDGPAATANEAMRLNVQLAVKVTLPA